MNVLELFAGIGGISLGFDWSGVHVVGQVEIDPFACRVLARHWPGVPRHDDVRTALDWWRSETRPMVDIVAGGYPCQPESTAGRRRGTEDARWLWPEFACIVDGLRPTYVLGENVVGHRTKGLRFVLADLHELGYTARAGIVSAAEVGAPHIRKRIFVLAKRTDAIPDADGGARWHEPGWHDAAGRQGPAEPGHDGGSESLADAARPGSGGAAINGDPWAAVSRHAVADTDGATGRRQAGHAIFGARAGTLGLGATQPGRRGDALADADGLAGRTRRAGDSSEGSRGWHAGGSGLSPDVPHTDGQGLGARRRYGRDHGTAGAEDEHWADPVGPLWWATEPEVGRVAYGVPARVDRLRTLGNAVVPRVAYAMVQLMLSDRWLEVKPC